jgi:hypothetical protein
MTSRRSSIYRPQGLPIAYLKRPKITLPLQPPVAADTTSRD